MCQESGKGLKVWTNTRERMIMSKIYGVVVWQLMCANFGNLEIMSAQFVAFEEENTCCICGSFEAFGKGILDNRIYYLD
jgi:hypothetical protein